MGEVAIVDAGMGNIGSVANMCRKLGVEATVARSPRDLDQASHLLLPGVGAFDAGMERLRNSDLISHLAELAVAGDVPLLGICLGMQLLFDASEEGQSQGLGWVPGRVRRLRGSAGEERVRIPHMGWNTLQVEKPGSLLSRLDDEARFYFVHSYAPCPDDDGDVLARTKHGESFVSAIERGNISGVQFHPEKSHRHGMAVLINFLGL